MNLDTPLLAHLADPVVRDLAWALSSPPLLNPSQDDPVWPDHAWYQALIADYQHRLNALDRRPDALHRAVQAVRGRRLGHYFEALWQFWLNDNDRYELRHNNVQIRNVGTTLGEIDCIVYDRQTDELQHWELALKFYLGRGDLREAASWIGPKATDRLDLKLARLLQHQLPLARHPASIERLTSDAMPISRQRIILKGRLFYPLPDGTVPRQQSWWCTLEGFTGTFGGQQLRWMPLERTQWLAPLRYDDAISAVAATDLAGQLETTDLCRPLCVAGFAAADEHTRGFIVPAAWPLSAAADNN